MGSLQRPPLLRPPQCRPAAGLPPGKLVPDQADVLLLQVLSDLTVDQVAEVLGKSPGAVKALQGLAALGRCLVPEGVPL
ncbi:MAG: RNA polymerase sigma factor [Actinomycetota bacterium]